MKYVQTFSVLLSAQCISSIEQIMKSVFLCVSESVCLSHKPSWTLCRSQYSTDLHRTCHHGSVQEMSSPIVLVEIRDTYVPQTESGMNFITALTEKYI